MEQIFISWETFFPSFMMFVSKTNGVELSLKSWAPCVAQNHSTNLLALAKKTSQLVSYAIVSIQEVPGLLYHKDLWENSASYHGTSISNVAWQDRR